MEYGGGYQRYKEQAVTTMTKGEMLKLLYEEIIKRLKSAKIAAQADNFELFESEVDRARDIINYLINTLDRKYPVSLDLARLYGFVNIELSRLTAGRNLDIIDEIIPLVTDFRDTFKEADRLAKGGSRVAVGG